MELTESDAEQLVKLILDNLKEIKAIDILLGIDESRQYGVEEKIGQIPLRLEPGITKASFREVGTTRRRPLTNKEMLQLIIDRLYQRLLVIPEIGHFLKQNICESLEWRVDTTFSSIERSQALAASGVELSPEGYENLIQSYQVLRNLLPNIIPEDSRDGHSR